MREIKFRAWNKEIGAMGIVSEISWGDNYLYASFDGKGEADMFAILSRTILMQYTGLKDKNGKEIYEGDIVKNDDGIWIVIWRIDSYGLAKKPNFEYTYKVLPWDTNEIIGNIYENPNLIEEAK